MRASTAWVVPALLAPALAAAQPSDVSKLEIQVEKLGGSVYLLRSVARVGDRVLAGPGGNVAASVGDDGVVLVDAPDAPLLPKFRAALRGIGDERVRLVVSTHWHPDHVGANGQLQRQAPILAHENVRRRMASGGVVAGAEEPRAARDALPALTFDRGATLHLNGEEIRVIHFPAGHTDGDAVVWFTRSNVVHMGDDFVTYGFPLVDREGGGSAQGMLGAVRAVIAMVPPDAKVIPGHGKPSTVADLRAYAAMLEDAIARVRRGIAAGRSAEQLKRENVLGGLESWSGFVTTDAFVEGLHDELSGANGAPRPR
jgi:glyoxylase-like metal-dependent hydrolase (beta-lactamase superfamily II)